MLHGANLARVLDLLNKHHELLRDIFDSEYESPHGPVPGPRKKLCKRLRALVSPHVGILFVSNPRCDERARQRVWSQIYDRIGQHTRSPFRFGNINQHRHLSLDNFVRILLDQKIQEVLPRGFDLDDFGLPRWLRLGGPLHDPEGPTTNRRIPRHRYGHDLIYSPTAQFMLQVSYPTAETYYNSIHGELLRPRQIRHVNQDGTSTYIDTNISWIDLHQVRVSQITGMLYLANALDLLISDNGFAPSIEDLEEYLHDIQEGPTTYAHNGGWCTVCNIIRGINVKAAAARINATRIHNLSTLMDALEEGQRIFEGLWGWMQATEQDAAQRNYHNDPNDRYEVPAALEQSLGNADEIVHGLLDFLAQREQDSEHTSAEPRLSYAYLQQSSAQDIEVWEDESETEQPSDMSDVGSSGSGSDWETVDGTESGEFSEDEEVGRENVARGPGPRPRPRRRDRNRRRHEHAAAAAAASSSRREDDLQSLVINGRSQFSLR
ncbi:hypothetical protein AAE478_005676 [Parahypoxylon ruwenzoriense]